MRSIHPFSDDEKNESRSLGTKNVPADPQKSSALTHGDETLDTTVLKEKAWTKKRALKKRASKNKTTIFLEETDAWMEKTAYNVNHRENKECEKTDQSV